MPTRKEIRDAAIAALQGAGLPAVQDGPSSVETFPATRVGTPEDEPIEDQGAATHRVVSLEVTHYERSGELALDALEVAEETTLAAILGDAALGTLVLAVGQPRVVTELSDQLQREAGMIVQTFPVEYLKQS